MLLVAFDTTKSNFILMVLVILDLRCLRVFCYDWYDDYAHCNMCYRIT
jgi:hypothetical protein